VDRYPQGGPPVVGHAVVVLEVVADKDLLALHQGLALFDLGLHVQLGVRGGPAFFVQGLVGGVLQLQLRKLVRGEP
jgi:hypothetical protein